MCHIQFFLTRLLTSDILFSTAVRAVLIAKIVILGIWALTSFILVLRIALVAKLVISGILSSIFLILALYSVFLTTSFFTLLLSSLKSIGVVSNFAIFNSSTSAFKLTRSDFAANLDVSIPVAFKSDLLHN